MGSAHSGAPDAMRGGLPMPDSTWIRVAHVTDFETSDRKTISAGDRPVLLLRHADGFYAVDNRCPHMGFPLDRGSVKDCILTCHWHHARFDLASGGTFDPWADDVRVFPVDVRDHEVWVDVALRDDLKAYQRVRVREGLEQNIPLVLAKSVIPLLDRGENPASPFRTGLEFGTRYRREGW